MVLNINKQAIDACLFIAVLLFIIAVLLLCHWSSSIKEVVLATISAFNNPISMLVAYKLGIKFKEDN